MAITGKALAQMTIPHEVTDACARVHCHSHDVDELLAVETTGYLACFECGHFYRTARELRRAHRAVLRDLYRGLPWWHWPVAAWHLVTLRAGQIPACAFCHHDF